MAAKKTPAKKQPANTVAVLEKQIAALIVKREQARDKLIADADKSVQKQKKDLVKLQAKEKAEKAKVAKLKTKKKTPALAKQIAAAETVVNKALKSVEAAKQTLELANSQLTVLKQEKANIKQIEKITSAAKKELSKLKDTPAKKAPAAKAKKEKSAKPKAAEKKAANKPAKSVAEAPIEAFAETTQPTESQKEIEDTSAAKHTDYLAQHAIPEEAANEEAETETAEAFSEEAVEDEAPSYLDQQSDESDADEDDYEDEDMDTEDDEVEPLDFEGSDGEAGVSRSIFDTLD